MNAVRDFKSASERKWQCDDQVDKLHIKRDDNDNDEHEQDKSKLRRKVHKHSCATQQLSA